MKLQGFHLQEPIEMALVQVYGVKLFYLDSTHKTTKYCLGRTCPFGLGLISGEDKVNITKTLSRFSLANHGANAGTDRAPGWEDPLREAGIFQFFDTYHFSQDIEISKGGLGCEATFYIQEYEEQSLP